MSLQFERKLYYYTRILPKWTMSLKLKTGETKGLELECSECERNFVVESQVKSIRAMACPYCGVASETQNIEVA